MWRLFAFVRVPVSLVALLLMAASSPVGLQAQSNLAFQVANMSEDLRLLDERVRAMSVEMEALRRENNQLRGQVSVAESALDDQMSKLVTVAMLNAELAKVVKQLEQRDEVLRQDLLVQVKKELESKLKEIRKIIGQMPETVSNKPPPTFTKNFPTTGIAYVVEPGDTISSIAQKLKSRTDWIINANEIVDPRFVQVGERLFIPQER